MFWVNISKMFIAVVMISARRTPSLVCVQAGCGCCIQNVRLWLRFRSDLARVIGMWKSELTLINRSRAGDGDYQGSTNTTLASFAYMMEEREKLSTPSPIYHSPPDKCLFTRCLGVLFTVVPVPGCLRVAAMMTAPSWDQLQRQDRLNQTFRHAHSLELQTKVHMNVRNHREGPSVS